MGKIVTIAAAMVVLTASWVNAGSFQTLADAAAVRPQASLHIQSGTVEKSGFMTIKSDSDIEPAAARPVATPVSAMGNPQVKPRPAVAFRERSTGAMAPPPALHSDISASPSFMAEANDDASSLESDLEKDLVLDPPAATEDLPKPSTPTPSVTPAVKQPKVERRAVEPQKAPAPEVKAERRKPTVKVKQMSPDTVFSKNGKPIRKVHQVTQNSQWGTAAGSYNAGHRAPDRVISDRQVRPRHARMVPMPPQVAQYNSYSSDYAEPQQRHFSTAPASNRFVRDGVTIKLAPGMATADASLPLPEEYRDDAGSDLLGAAAEIIGLPFAFISSLF